jgi:hypothetical protein
VKPPGVGRHLKALAYLVLSGGEFLMRVKYQKTDKLTQAAHASQEGYAREFQELKLLVYSGSQTEF